VTVKLPLSQFVWRLVIMAFLFLSSLSVHAQEAPVHWAPVDPSLQQQMLRSDGAVSFLVILDEQPHPDAFLAGKELNSASRQAKAEALYGYLTDFARQRQASLWRLLDAQGVDYRPFYIVNAIEVSGDPGLILELRKRPEVKRLAANPAVALDLPDAPSTPTERTVQLPNAPAGITYTKAPQVWALGYQGEGIVIASQDTGVYWEHPALKPKYRGWNAETETASHAYNWFDPWGTAGRDNCNPSPQVPCDDNGHGTHTVGTLLGSDSTMGTSGFSVGMAPAAQWIGCRNMLKGVGTPGSYIACFQFFMAPHPQNGDPFTEGDPARAPHIINNSWYCPPAEGCDFATLQQVVQTVRAAGQLVVASAGNTGPGCATIQYPTGAYAEVFTVGSHNSISSGENAGKISSFSSRGPVASDGSGRLKPDIVAPGEGVYSTSLNGQYSFLSGTSMAAPHVAGATALLWSAAPHLIGKLDETRQILLKSATQVPDFTVTSWHLADSGRVVCQSSAEAVTPNTTYGYGRLNVAAAVEMASRPASLRVTVLLLPATLLGNAEVVLVDQLTGQQYTDYTDELGQIVFPRLYPGVYSLNVQWMGMTWYDTLVLGEEQAAEVTAQLRSYIYLPFIDADYE
jgi:serine protease AprX